MIKLITEANIGEGTRVLVRVDWNTPLDNQGNVSDDSRIRASAKTINHILDRGGIAITLSHLGDGSGSLLGVAEKAKEVFAEREVKFVQDPWNKTLGEEAMKKVLPGEIIVIENLRFWKEKENDPDFAERLSNLGDIYVNEAFPVSHRKHTSIVLLPRLLPCFAGFRFLEEFEKLSTAFNPEHPFFFILGGAKFETKLPLVEKFLDIADNIFIGGAMVEHARALPIGNHPKIIFPTGEKNALDANFETIENLKSKIENSKFVLWNGPLGNYENGYTAGTATLASYLSESKAKTIVGGGDTLSAIKELNLENKFFFVSTAGGAMLDFLANETLPGIDALN